VHARFGAPRNLCSAGYKSIALNFVKDRRGGTTSETTVRVSETVQRFAIGGQQTKKQFVGRRYRSVSTNDEIKRHHQTRFKQRARFLAPDIRTLDATMYRPSE